MFNDTLTGLMTVSAIEEKLKSEERMKTIITLDLSSEEQKTLREFLERYDFDLRSEIANTDDREFRSNLKQKEVIMKSTFHQQTYREE